MNERVFTTVVILALLTAALSPVAAQEERGQFTATQETDTVYPGDTYSVDAEDGRDPERNGTESPEFVAIVTRANRNKGLINRDYADVNSSSGTFDLGVPDDPRHGRYRTIVISSGFDGQFGDGLDVDDIERLIAEHPDWTYSQLEETIRSRTAGEAGSDDAMEVLRFSVTADAQRLVVDPLRRRVLVGDEMTVSGTLDGGSDGNTSVEIEVSDTFNDGRVVLSETASIDEDGRWETDIDTEGLLVGWYEVVFRTDETPTKRLSFQVVSGNVTEETAPEPLFTPEALANRTRRARLPYEPTTVADLDSLAIGEERAIIAQVDSAGRQNQLRSFLVSDGSREDPEVPFRLRRRTRARVLTTRNTTLDVGDWGLFYVTRIEEESEEMGEDGGEVIGTYQALNVVDLGSDPPGIRITSDEVSDFLGVHVVFDSRVRYVRERIVGADSVYLEAGSGTVHAAPGNADSFAVGQEVTVSGRLMTERVDETAVESFSPITVGESAAESSFSVVSVEHPRIEPRGSNASEFTLPAEFEELTGYEFTTVSELTLDHDRRIAFNATVRNVATTRGTNTSVDRALVAGPDGGEAILEYPSTIELRRNYSVLVRGVHRIDRTRADLLKVTPAGVGIYDYGRPVTDSENATTTNRTTPPPTDATNTTATTTRNGAIIRPVAIENTSSEQAVPFWLNVTSENVGQAGTGSHSIALPKEATLLSTRSGKNVSVSQGEGNRTVVRATGTWEAGGRDTLAVRVVINRTGLYGVEYGSPSNRSSMVVNVTERPEPPASIVLLDSGHEFLGAVRHEGERYYVYRYRNRNPLGTRLEVINRTGARVSNGTLARQVIDSSGASGGWSGLNVTRLKVFGPGGLVVGVGVVGLRFR